MIKNIIKILLILVLLVLPVFIFAHPGRTDANGCHTNKKTGEYHCHTTSNKSVRTEARQTASTNSKTGFAKCGTKYVCNEMSSCSEAKYFFSVCGLSDLDRDNDNIPCEIICK